MKKIISILVSAIISLPVFSQKEQIVIPNGHSLKVQKVVLDDQQKYLYTAELEKIIMWNAATGVQMYTFPLGEDNVRMAINHAGDKIAFARQGKLFCYSTLTGKQLFGVDYSLYQTKTLCFTADDKHILLPDSDGIAEVDVSTGTHVYLTNFLFDNHFSELYITNDGNDFLLIGEQDWQLRDARTGIIKTDQKFPEKGRYRWYLPFSKMIAYAVYINPKLSIVTFQDIKNGTVVKKLNNASDDTNIKLISSTTDNHFFMSEGDYKNTKYKLYNTSDFNVEKIFPDGSPFLFYGVNAAFIGEKNLLFGAGYKDVASLNTQTGSVIKKFKRTIASLGFEVLSSYEYNSGSGVLNWVCDDSTLKRINLFTMKSERNVNIFTNVENIAISSGGDSLAVFDSYKCYLKNIATANLVKADGKIRTTSGERTLYSFSSDGKFIFYPDKSKLSPDGDALYKWNLATDIKTEIFHYNFIDAISFSADKQFLSAVITIKEKKYAEVINLSTGKVIFKQMLNDYYNEGKYFLHTSLDDKKLLFIVNDTLSIYDLATAQKLYTGSASDGVRPASPPTEKGSITASNDLSMIATGSIKGMLTVYKSDGTKLYEILAHYSEIRNIFFSPDGRLIYTVSHDQTIKTWQAATGKLLGTLYLFSGGNDYVFVDEFGRFDGTPEGIKKLYYLKNRNQISLDLVYEKYYTPGLYQRLANGEIFPPMPSDDLKTAPKVKLTYAEKQRNLEVTDDVPIYQNTTGLAEITVTASASEDAIDEIRLFQNGKVLNLTTRNLIVADEKSSTATKKYSVSLLQGTNEIRAVALNTQRTESQPDIINVIYNSTSSSPSAIVREIKENSIKVDVIDKNATMYLMVIGINAYTNKINPLKYALPDATSFKDEIEKDAKSVLANVKTYFITDAKADKVGIVNAFNEIKKVAKPQDVFVFYYAGHGYISPTNKEFYLVSADVADGGESLIKNGIPAKDLQQYAVDIQAQKQLFILDACQSAGAFDAMLKHDGEQQKSLAVVARSTGTHWMAASGSTETAKEFGELGHGAFTYVLLQALKGQAASNKMITVNGMKNFLQVQVPELVKKYGSNNQYPASYGFGNDFPVEIVK